MSDPKFDLCYISSLATIVIYKFYKTTCYNLYCAKELAMGKKKRRIIIKENSPWLSSKINGNTINGSI